MALKYNGVNLTPPDPIVQRPPASGSITDLLGFATAGQNSANNANSIRYKQGLGVLTGGYNQGAGFISKALGDIKNVGASQLADINQQEKNGIANVQQSAIGRGIGNTTVMDTLGAIPQRSAELARLTLADQQAQARSNIRLQQAGQSNRGADSISSFIGARNDIAPGIGDLAPLIQNAAANQTSKTKSTSTITKGTLSTPTFMIPGGGGSLGSNTAINGGGGGGGGGGAPITGGGDPIVPPPQQQPNIPNTPNTPPPPIPNQPPPNTPPPTPNTPPNTPCASQSTDPSKCGYISITWSGCNDPNVGPIQKMIHMCPGH